MKISLIDKRVTNESKDFSYDAEVCGCLWDIIRKLSSLQSKELIAVEITEEAVETIVKELDNQEVEEEYKKAVISLLKLAKTEREAILVIEENRFHPKTQDEDG